MVRLILLLLFMAITAHAQDSIIKENGKNIVSEYIQVNQRHNNDISNPSSNRVVSKSNQPDENISNGYDRDDNRVYYAVIFNILLTFIGAFLTFLLSIQKFKSTYSYSQRMSIKEKLSHSKTPLVKAAEELNRRLCKFSKQINKHWHEKEEAEWKKPNECYYLKSFVYRILVFFYWVEKAENDVYNFDFSKAGKTEKVYLKYIMTFNNFFCDAGLLKELNYDETLPQSHFFKEKFRVYISYIERDGKVIPYDQFEEMMETNCNKIMPLIKFITNIKEDKNNEKRNILVSFHLFLMLFLNNYGLDYHKTKEADFRNYVYNYDIVIKKGLEDFFRRNKISGEVSWIINNL